jgi:hypothetical protein
MFTSEPSSGSSRQGNGDVCRIAPARDQHPAHVQETPEPQNPRRRELIAKVLEVKGPASFLYPALEPA